MYEDACAKLHRVLNDLPRYSFDQLDDQVPANGIYLTFESGEEGHGGNRIVLIGSHTGAGRLASRLREQVRLNKDRSILKKHVGRAILQRDNDPYLPIWNLDLTTKKAREEHGHTIDKTKKAGVEDAVSAYIEQNVSVSVLPSNDPDDAYRQKKACMGTVSSCSHCLPSPGWLGRHADPRIAQSGLWQIPIPVREGVRGVGFSEHAEVSKTLLEKLDQRLQLAILRLKLGLLLVIRQIP
jgi:hypothetical protein